jgi:deoxyribodipyrimidine photo-lyase
MGAPVIPVYVLDDETPGRWRLGGASRWWLHHSLASLQESLARLAPGHAVAPKLVLRRGRADHVIPALAREIGAGAVYWNRCYEPFAIIRDTALKSAVGAIGIEAESFNASLLHEPWTIKTGAGGPFKIFTPFWNACQAALVPEKPVPFPRKLVPHLPAPPSDCLDDWTLLPTRPDWADGLRSTWQAGEVKAKQSLKSFHQEGLALYGMARDRPDRSGTSRLSPYLHFGEIGPRQIANALSSATSSQGLAPYMKEIGWREFAYQLLFHFPHLPEEPLRPDFARFPWRDDE